MNIFERIKKWNQERMLDKQEFNLEVELLNILEELIEMSDSNIKSNEARKLAKKLKDTIIYNANMSTKQDKVDALCDIIVYSIGALLKLGVEPECAINETLKEIESRTGSIVDGKFIKDISEEAKIKWYKANYKECIKDK